MNSAAPAHSRRTAVTVPLRHRITVGTVVGAGRLRASTARSDIAMSKRRTERLLSIVVLLLSSRRYLTAEQIRASVSGYPDAGESFKRMFERDKEELRELGIPLETGKSSAFDDEIGYRIRRQDYELPEIQLAADEAAVLGIAARVWQSAELAGAAGGRLLKLKAAR